MTADYTFVNERLAKHYDIPGVAGDEFRRVQYPNDQRRGILGHGSVLTRHTLSDTASPVQRGKLVRERLLCEVLPPPRPDVDPTVSGGRPSDPPAYPQDPHRFPAVESPPPPPPAPTA